MRWGSDISSIGSKGGIQRAYNTTALSHEGIRDRTGGLSLSAPRGKCVTRGCLPTDCPPRLSPPHKPSRWSGSTLQRVGPAGSLALYGRAGDLRNLKWKVYTSRHTVSSLRELWIGGESQNLGWETGSYELCPLRGHTHNFHSSWRGWKMEPPACERRYLLKGISHGSRRGEKSGVLEWCAGRLWPN